MNSNTIIRKQFVIKVYTYERWSDKEIPNYEHIRWAHIF